MDDFKRFEYGEQVKTEYEKLFDILMRNHGVVVPNAYLYKIDELLNAHNVQYTAEKVDKWGSQYVYKLKTD